MEPLRQRIESLWPWAVLPFLCAGPMHAQRGLVDDALRKAPPESWRTIALAEAGVEIAIPRDFERLPTQPLRPLRFRGNLGGGKVELEVAWLTKNFATVSRVLLGLAADSTLLRVDAGRTDGLVTAVCERELVGTKHRRIGFVICPRREAILVECDIPKSAPSTTSGAARELLRFVRLVERTGLTAVQFGEEERLRRRIEAGFIEADRKKVEIRQSTFYRLFTTAPVDETILEFLETELLPRVVAICGVSPSRSDPLSLFVHRGRSNYILASMQLGLSAQQGEAMAGHAWDDNYATWFEHARSAVHVHEGTHQYMTATLGLDGGGPWLQEGFARWIETQYSHELPARNARNLLRSRKDFPKLEALISERSFLFGGGGRLGFEALQLYDISASFVRYLAQEHRSKFRTVLLRTGVLPSGEFRLVARALEDTIGIAFPKLEEDWRRWLREDL
ncbi:MAG: hypothetical protein KDC95_21790 [Planctomycetes bacterium]|nr:hypothetical protein [Planctomycetota bacterium]